MTRKQLIPSARVLLRLSLALALVAMLPGEAGAHHVDVVGKLDRGRTELVSVSSNNEQGDGPSGDGISATDSELSASSDGRLIAFSSCAGNLHPADVNGKQLSDVFVFDRKTRKLELISRTPQGLASVEPPDLPPGGGPECSAFAGSNNPVISGNGRYVAFESTLPLAGSDKPGACVPCAKIFVRDLKNQTTELVSRDSDGEPVTTFLFAPGFRHNPPDISDDGRFVVFTSDVPDVTQESCRGPTVAGVEVPLTLICERQGYVRDRKKQRTLLISRSNAGERANSSVGPGYISGNGRYVAFATDANNLLDDEIMGTCVPDGFQTIDPCHNVFVHDIRTRTTELISVSRDGSAAHRSNLPRGYPEPLLQQVLSRNGRFVAFYSGSPNIVPANPYSPPSTPVPNGSRAFVRDRKTGRTERVLVDSTGTPLAQSNVPRHTITDDGRYVLLPRITQASFCPFGETVPKPEGPCWHEADPTGDFVFDRKTGQTDWVMWFDSVHYPPPDDAPPGARTDSGAQIGGNGRFIVFAGSEEDPPRVAGDTNDSFDVFVRDIERRPLNTGGLGSKPPPPKPPDEEPPICVGDVCIPPQGGVVSSFESDHDIDDSFTAQGANLYGASLAYRPELKDLYAAIELEYMGPSLAGGTAVGLPWILYGLRFEVEGARYEVRASSLSGGTFGLFNCSEKASLCTPIAELKGGYGTTGERAVFSLPLDAIGLSGRGEINYAVAFSGIGTYATGATQVLDTVRLGGSGEKDS